MSRKIGLGIIAIAVIALAIVMSGLLTIVDSNLNFAGFNFQQNIFAYSSQCGGGSGIVELQGEFLILKSSQGGSGCPFASYALVSTDVTSIDELLVIADANAYVSAGYQSGATASFSASIKGSEGGEVSSGFGISTNPWTSGGSGGTKSEYLSPRVIKLKNNFDGTWSYLESLNVGDIFIVKSTQPIKGNAILELQARSSLSGEGNGVANIQAVIYNIVRKENAFALCKADKYAYDLNKDGVIATDGSECVTLNTIVLNSEEAIKESFDAKLARITAELEAKNAGLTADIEALKQQLAQQQTTEQITALQSQITLLESQLATASDKTLIQNQIDTLRQQQLNSNNLQDQLNALQAELKETKSVLADVQAKDKNVINTIEAQEQFKKPSFIKGLWNKFIAWIKNIFT